MGVSGEGGQIAVQGPRAISDITGLQTALDGKAATSHSHAIADTTGLQAALDGKAATSHTHAQSDVTGLVAALAAKIATALIGAAGGVAPLDGSAKVALAYLPDSVLGALKWQGVWNANTNSPAIPAASSANLGFYYKVGTAGATEIDGISDWKVGDWIVSNGSAWEKADHTDSVASVAGLVGAITADALVTALGLEIDDVSGLQTALDAKVDDSEVATSGANKILRLDGDGKLPALSGENLTDLPSGGGGGFETLTSGATVTLDFSANEMAKLVVAHNVTFAFSNLAAGKRKEVILSAGSTFTLAYPAGIKNVGGTALPSSIGASDNITLRFSSAGTSDAEVRVEFVNGAGVVFALTAPANVSVHKSGSAARALASNVSGGPNLGYAVVSITSGIGTFTLSSTGDGIVGTPTIDVETERYTAVQLLTTKGGAVSLLAATLTWYPALSEGEPQVGSGSISLSITDGVNTANWNFSVTAYGADEVQNLAFTNTGVPTSPSGGFYTLYHPSYGTTGGIDASGGSTTAQAALNALMGANAPTASGGAESLNFTYSNGTLAHTDTSQLVYAAGTPAPHDTSGNIYFSAIKDQTGDGVSLADRYSGSWDMFSLGTLTLDGSTVFTRGSGSVITHGGQTYSFNDMGSSWVMECTSGFGDYGSISFSPNLGPELTGTVTTTTEGNT